MKEVNSERAQYPDIVDNVHMCVAVVLIADVEYHHVMQIFTLICTVPSAPRNLQIVAVNTTYISLSWESPAILYASQLGPYYVTYGIANTEMVQCPASC